MVKTIAFIIITIDIVGHCNYDDGDEGALVR